MVSTAGGVVIAIVVLLIAAVVGWILFTQLRARRLGLPPPSLSSYLPWKKSDSSYSAPRPARGGVIGWFNDQIRKFKSRNTRSATGAYEQPLHGSSAARGNRGFGPLDPDEAWDTRVGNEAEGYGYHEEQELGLGSHNEYSGAGYDNRGPAATLEYDDLERGRPMSRELGPATAAHQNPFDDDAQSSLRGISPRPMDTTVVAAGHKAVPDRPGSAGSGSTHHERRSIFREEV